MKERGSLSGSLGLPSGSPSPDFIRHLCFYLGHYRRFCFSPASAPPFQLNHLWASWLTSLTSVISSVKWANYTRCLGKSVGRTEVMRLKEERAVQIKILSFFLPELPAFEPPYFLLFPSLSPIPAASLLSPSVFLSDFLLETICDSAFIHSLTFIKHTLCTRTYASTWGLEMRRPSLCPLGAQRPLGTAGSGAGHYSPHPVTRAVVLLLG